MGRLGSSLKEQLTVPMGRIWLAIAGDVLPGCAASCAGGSGIERRWISPDDAVLSACRTFFRRLGRGRGPPTRWKALDDLESLLFAVAHHKLISATTPTKERESRHVPRVVEVRHEIVEEPDQMQRFLG